MGDENTGGNGCWSLAQNGLWGRGRLLICTRISREKFSGISVQLLKYMECWGEEGEGEIEIEIDFVFSYLSSRNLRIM